MKICCHDNDGISVRGIIRAFDRKCGCTGLRLCYLICKHQDKIRIMTAEESKEYMAKTEVHQLFEVRRHKLKGGNSYVNIF